jgi:hypothetical protein
MHHLRWAAACTRLQLAALNAAFVHREKLSFVILLPNGRAIGLVTASVNDVFYSSVSRTVIKRHCQIRHVTISYIQEILDCMQTSLF